MHLIVRLGLLTGQTCICLFINFRAFHRGCKIQIPSFIQFMAELQGGKRGKFIHGIVNMIMYGRNLMTMLITLNA